MCKSNSQPWQEKNGEGTIPMAATPCLVIAMPSQGLTAVEAALTLRDGSSAPRWFLTTKLTLKISLFFLS